MRSHTRRDGRRVLVAAAVVAVAVIAPLAPARADTVAPPPAEIPPTDTDFFASPVGVVQFDPALGSLQSVTVSVDATVTGSMGVENTSPASGSVGEMELSAEVAVTLASNPGETLTIAAPAVTETFDLPVFDGTLDFGGTSGVTFAGIEEGDSFTETFTDAATLAAATGDGTFEFLVDAVGTSFADATGGNVSTFFLSQAAVTITVTYDYEPVPVGIAVLKQTNGADAGDPFGDDVPRVAPGDPVTWTYTVTNPGGPAVEDVLVVDDQIGAVSGPPAGDADGDGLLDPGEEWVFAASGVAEDLATTAATTVDGCPDPDGTPRRAYRNVATASGTSGGEVVTAEDVSHYCNPFEAPGPGKIAVLLTDDVGDDVLASGRAFDYAVVVANVGEGPVQPDPMLLGWAGGDGRYVVLAEPDVVREGDCDVAGTSLTIDRPLEAGEVVTCLIAVRVVDVSTRSVVATVSANGVVLDEEPVLVQSLLSAIAGPEIILPDIVLPVDVLGVSLAASIDSPPAVAPGLLAATGATNNTAGVVLLSLLGVALGLLLVGAGRILRLRAGP